MTCVVVETCWVVIATCMVVMVTAALLLHTRTKCIFLHLFFTGISSNMDNSYKEDDQNQLISKL